jgi:hypothetical protein
MENKKPKGKRPSDKHFPGKRPEHPLISGGGLSHSSGPWGRSITDEGIYQNEMWWKLAKIYRLGQSPITQIYSEPMFIFLMMQYKCIIDIYTCTYFLHYVLYYMYWLMISVLSLLVKKVYKYTLRIALEAKWLQNAESHSYKCNGYLTWNMWGHVLVSMISRPNKSWKLYGWASKPSNSLHVLFLPAFLNLPLSHQLWCTHHNMQLRHELMTLNWNHTSPQVIYNLSLPAALRFPPFDGLWPPADLQSQRSAGQMRPPPLTWKNNLLGFQFSVVVWVTFLLTTGGLGTGVVQSHSTPTNGGGGVREVASLLTTSTVMSYWLLVGWRQLDNFTQTARENGKEWNAGYFRWEFKS